MFMYWSPQEQVAYVVLFKIEGGKRVHTFLNGISQKEYIIARLQFELTDYNDAFNYVSHHASPSTGNADGESKNPYLLSSTISK